MSEFAGGGGESFIIGYTVRYGRKQSATKASKLNTEIPYNSQRNALVTYISPYQEHKHRSISNAHELQYLAINTGFLTLNTKNLKILDVCF